MQDKHDIDICTYTDSSEDEEQEGLSKDEYKTDKRYIDEEKNTMEENKNGNNIIPSKNPQLPQGLLPKDPHLPQGLLPKDPHLPQGLLPKDPHLPQGLPLNSNPLLRSRLAEATIIQELYDTYLSK
jgi:hypothetical protein